MADTAFPASILRRRLCWALALALLLSAAATASAAPHPTRPAKPHVGPNNRWYRVELAGSDSLVAHAIALNGSGGNYEHEHDHWNAKSRVAVILYRDVAIGPTARVKKSKTLFEYSLEANVGGYLTSFTSHREVTDDPSCPRMVGDTRLTDPGLIEGLLRLRVTEAPGAKSTASLILNPGSKLPEILVHVSAWSCPDSGADVPEHDYKQPGGLPPSPEPCASGLNSDVTGVVNYGGGFTLTVDCKTAIDNPNVGGVFHSIEDLTTHFTITFTPCPNKGLSVRHC